MMRAPRKIEWALIAVTALLAVPLFAARGGTPNLGKATEITITATPEDKGLLECSLARVIGGHRCAYRTAQSQWDQQPAPRDLIQPFVATDGDVYLMSGLFEDPAVKPRLGRRWHTVRFVARCQVRMLDNLVDVAIRFHPTDPWLPTPEAIYVAEVQSCQIE